ncbi:MAG: DoxX family protein [Agarilytica sp.]
MNIFRIADRYARKVGDLIPESIVSLAGRIAIFVVFWRSVQTKIDGANIAGQNFAFWNVTDSTFMLFEYEYGLPLPNIAAYLGTFGEFFLSLSLLLGVLTRFSALGLLIMTAVIQFVYPDGWSVHILWAGILLYLIKTGGGEIALDRFIK